MKKLRSFGAIIVVCMLILTGCANENYDALTLDEASRITSEMGFATVYNPFKDGTRYFKVTKNSEREFLVDVNGSEMCIQTLTNEQLSEYVPKNIKNISNKNLEIVSRSKKLIFKYIDASKVMEDKKGLMDYISRLRVAEASFTDEACVPSYFSFKDDCIYINTELQYCICEWMIVHELVHAMSYYTHGCIIDEEPYAFSLFNEVLTDIITASLNPKIDENIQSEYAIYYSLLAPYINLFGEKAIKAYFYGYNTIYKLIAKDEFEFFVLLIENFEAENSEVYYNNLIFKWYSAY